jgi:hypothetical protein
MKCGRLKDRAIRGNDTAIVILFMLRAGLHKYNYLCNVCTKGKHLIGSFRPHFPIRPFNK